MPCMRDALQRPPAVLTRAEQIHDMRTMALKARLTSDPSSACVMLLVVGSGMQSVSAADAGARCRRWQVVPWRHRHTRGCLIAVIKTTSPHATNGAQDPK